ncbi:MAG TPA: class I SAM-dependent methyltransferase [Acidimicrobiales bacterium]|nr:class I SAM-dependent methyltransferase [Acidimicrobiales bacterium]
MWRRHWNHNTHYHRVLLDMLPPRCDRVLDIGCGDGLFARRLAGRSTSVVALDPDAEQVTVAKATCANAANVAVVRAEFLSVGFLEASFDAVTCLAVIHHLPLEDAIAKMVRLLRPGGRLVLLGVWPDVAMPAEIGISVAAVVVNRCYIVLWGDGEMSSPACAPQMSMSDARRAVVRLLPGATVKRRLLWRFTVDWVKPGGPLQPLASPP